MQWVNQTPILVTPITLVYLSLTLCPVFHVCYVLLDVTSLDLRNWCDTVGHLDSNSLVHLIPVWKGFYTEMQMRGWKDVSVGDVNAFSCRTQSNEWVTLNALSLSWVRFLVDLLSFSFLSFLTLVFLRLFSGLSKWIHSTWQCCRCVFYSLCAMRLTVTVTNFFYTFTPLFLFVTLHQMHLVLLLLLSSLVSSE